MQKIGLILTLWLTFSGLCLANGLGVHGGYIDTEDLGDSVGIGGKFQIDLPGGLNIEGRTVMYDDLGKDLAAGGEDVRTDLEIWPIEMGLTLDIPVGKRFIPYIGGGIGWHLLEADVTVGEVTQHIDLDDEFGFYLVGGFNMELGENIAIYGEYLYRQVEGSLEDDHTSKLVKDAVAVDLGGFSINLGLLLRW
ncbi:MAG: outer membrane beta-barrel protein [Verrucomicrobiota bacterium]